MNGRFWTEHEDAVLREFYPREDIFAKEIGAMIGRTAGQVQQRAARLGVKKPESFRSIAGKIGSRCAEAKEHQFHKGHVPDNKGKKMSPEMYTKAAPTMFKKGSVPPNHREVGSERITRDGYVEVKVAEGMFQWRLKHRLLWEEHNGPIPAGCNIQFKDGNRLNVTIENLYLITRSEQLKTKNSLMARYPKELADIIRLRGSVKRQITMHNKKHSKHE